MLFISFCCPHHFVGSSLQFWNSLTYRWLQGTGNIKDVVYLSSWYMLLVEFHTTPMSRPGSLGSRWKASENVGTWNLQGTWNHHHFHFLGIYAQPPTAHHLQCSLPKALLTQLQVHGFRGATLRHPECFRDFRGSKSLGIPFANLENPLLYVYIHTYAIRLSMYLQLYTYIYASPKSQFTGWFAIWNRMYLVDPVLNSTKNISGAKSTLAFWNQSLGDLKNHREKGHIHLDSGIHLILLFSCLYIGTAPHAATVATKIIQFLVGNPYKISFVTVTGCGVDQILESLTDFIGDESLL